MSKVQKFYRELRKHVSPEDARYAAPRLLAIMQQRYGA